MPHPPPPTRVLTLVTRMNIGGPARHVLGLARGMPDDIELVVAAGRPPRVEGELTDPDVTVRPLPLVRAVSPRTELTAYRHTRRLLAATRPRIVHTHMAKAGAIGRLAARSFPVRTVHTFHGHVLSGYFSPRVQSAFLRTERHLAARTDVLVAVSAEVRDALLDLGIGRANQYEVVPLGIELGSAERPASGRLRRAIGLDVDVPLVGVVARLVPIKDHATLFRAVAQVEGLHLAVLGDGECRGELEALAARLGIADRVHLTGWWHDVPDALADLDIVALTSRNEGTPLALMEAAAAGRPVVATDVGGVRGLVEHGGSGFLVAPGDAGAVALHLRTLVADPAAAPAMGARGRELAARLAAAHDPVPRLVELYRSLADGRR